MCVQNRRNVHHKTPTLLRSATYLNNLHHNIGYVNHVDGRLIELESQNNELSAPIENGIDERFVHYDNSSSNNQSIEYLEIRLLKFFKNWLRAKGFWSLVKCVIKSISFENVNEAPRLFEINLNDGDGFSRKMMVKVLKFTKLFNACMIICHIILLLKAINFGSNQYKVGSNLVGTEQSKSLSSFLVAGGDGNICFHLIWVTILDFLNNLYWYHSKESISPVRNGNSRRTLSFHRITWLRSVLHILTSPRHLFQATYVCLFIAMGPLDGAIGALLSPFNSINQILRHYYNYHRVTRYLKMLKPTGKIFDNDENSNINVRDMEHDINHDDNNNNITSTTETTVSNQATEMPELCREEANNSDWSRWPINEGESRRRGFGEYTLHKFERIHMMSQMLGVKLTILTIVLHIDALNSRRSLESLISLACLVEAFLAMYSYYNKYYSRYMERRGHLLRRVSLLVLQLRQQQLQRLQYRAGIGAAASTSDTAEVESSS